MWHVPYDPKWETRGEPHFTKDWTAKTFRLQPPSRWNWLRIWLWLFIVLVAVLVIRIVVGLCW